MNYLNHDQMQIHLLGIRGSGMSALAYLLKSLGHAITGSDLKERPHDASKVLGSDLVVYSSAVGADNVERIEAKRMNIPDVHRSVILAELMDPRKTIAVTGMHGKTSTTGFISNMFIESDLDPMVAAGGNFSFLHGNARFGRGPWAVFEADESDGTLLCYHPEIALITNLELEHMDFFKDFDDILIHFRKFVSQVKGCLVINGDDLGCQALIKCCPEKKFITYGFSEGVEVRGLHIQSVGWGAQFQVSYCGQKLPLFNIRIPGVHQISNALGAIALGISLGLNIKSITSALENFNGAQRRFQLRAQIKGVSIVDDYAHHPSEIQATLKAARTCFNGKILAVFQPHRYSRTQYFKKEFGKSFSDADHVVITDIYPSNEQPISGVSGRLIYDEISQWEKPVADYIPDLEQVKEFILNHYLEYEAILFLGAGNISEMSEKIINSLSLRAESEAISLINGIAASRHNIETLNDGKKSSDFCIENFRGKVLKNELLSRHTTFRLGGPADLWVEPVDIEDLICIQEWAREKGLPVFVIGNGSNVIVRDGGMRGVVVRLSNPFFCKVNIEGDGLRAGTGLSLAEVIKIALDAGLSGLENLKGIPGTVGGALHFNAGAYGSEIGDCVENVWALNTDGSLECLSAEKLRFQYRSTLGLRGKIALQAKFRLTPSDARKIHERIVHLKIERALRYPKLPNAGCIFRNPGDNFAGKLIDEVGLKNFSIGEAQVSGEHANFIVNRGGAKSSEVLNLIEEVRRRVFEQTKVHLDNEVEVVGED